MNINVTKTGLKAVKKALEKEFKKYEEALAAAIYQKGFAIAKDALLNTPVDQGVLRGSQYVAPPAMVGHDPVVEVGYGTNYALAVHERVEVFHKIGGPLYLKTAIDKHRAGYERWIREKTKENHRRGIRASFVQKERPTKPNPPSSK